MKNINLSQLTLATFLTLAFAPSAEAIIIPYSISGTYIDRLSSVPQGSFSGSFNFNTEGTNGTTYYSDISITTTTNAIEPPRSIQFFQGFNYVTTDVSINSTPTTLLLTFNDDQRSYAANFTFTSSLATGGVNQIVISTTGSREFQSVQSDFTSDARLISSGAATEVPLETDALPALIGLTFAGAGIYLKRKKSNNAVSSLIKED